MYLIGWSTTIRIAQQSVPDGAARQSRKASLHHCHTERSVAESSVSHPTEHNRQYSTTRHSGRRGSSEPKSVNKALSYRAERSGVECISSYIVKPSIQYNALLCYSDRPTPPDEIHSLGMTCYIDAFRLWRAAPSGTPCFALLSVVLHGMRYTRLRLRLRSV